MQGLLGDDEQSGRLHRHRESGAEGFGDWWTTTWKSKDIKRVALRPLTSARGITGFPRSRGQSPFRWVPPPTWTPPRWSIPPVHQLPDRPGAGHDQRPAGCGVHRDGGLVHLSGTQPNCWRWWRMQTAPSIAGDEATGWNRPAAGVASAGGGPDADSAGAGQTAVERCAALGGDHFHPADGSSAGIPGGGPGIRRRARALPKRLPHPFRRFNRLGVEGGDGHEGAGLGLAICIGIAEAHGGRV